MSKRVKHHLEHLLSHSHEYVVLAAPLVLENSMILFAGTSLLFVVCVCIFADRKWHDEETNPTSEDRDF